MYHPQHEMVTVCYEVNTESEARRGYFLARLRRAGLALTGVIVWLACSSHCRVSTCERKRRR